MSKVSQAICEMISSLPGGFERIHGRPGFWFRAVNAPNLHSFVIAQHSAKHRAIGVDVVSSIFDAWDKQYGGHQLVRATGLQNVRLRSGMTPMEEECYRYDSDFIETIGLIREHLLRYALPWFAGHASEMANDDLVRCGIEATASDPLPSLDALKTALRRRAWDINADKWRRKETAILAMHLLAWAKQKRERCSTC